MNGHADFHIGPLSWVKGEIDLAMQRGLASLRTFAANPADGASMTQAQAQLREVHAALEIAGMGAVTRVFEELEGLLEELEKEPAVRTQQHFATAEEAVLGIAAYLDAIISGAPDQALRLYPVYRNLLSARGRAEADPVDLYFPDLSPQPPRRGKVPEGPEKHFREQRGRFQRGLLVWLKGEASGAADMRAAVEAIELVQESASQHAFWWVALAFFDALESKSLHSDIDAKRMCNRIEQQIRRLEEGAQSVAERQMREVLYCVARAQPSTDHLRAVQELYQLERTLPEKDGAARWPRDFPGLKPAPAVAPSPAAVSPERSPAPAPAAMPAAPEPEQFVLIGENKVSEALFAMFESEAKMHLQVMAQERDVLMQQAVITDALIHAVHTLAGNSATVGLEAVRELAHAFELALLKLATMTLSEAEEKLVGSVIEALAAMVAAGTSLQQLQARPDIVDRLRRATAPVMVADIGPTLLPEEEGAISREP